MSVSRDSKEEGSMRDGGSGTEEGQEEGIMWLWSESMRKTSTG